jgi:hypothetical protein
MRGAACVLLAAAVLGCGSDDSTVPDVADVHVDDAADVLPDDGAPPDVPHEAEVPGDDGAEVPGDDGAEAPADVPVEDAADTTDEGGASCAPTWHPTSCSDCGGGGGGGSCYQDCTASACGDGRRYRAECADGVTTACHCFIDDVEVCTCTSSHPTTAMGCEPEEWGGANCCWNVG